MSIESAADWDGLHAAAGVASRTLELLVRACEPGVSTGDLDQLAARFFAACGARSAPRLVYGFPGSVLISVDEEIVHGVPGRRVIGHGALVSLDVTVELDGYVADAARSVVAGSGHPLAHALVDCAEAAFTAGLGAARAGGRVRNIGRAVSGEVRRRGFTVVHGLAGHGVGRTIHEPPTVPNEWDPHATARLTEGLVITIEPMVTCGSGHPVEGSDGWTLRTRDGRLAAHHEDTIVISGGRPVVLTATAA